MKTLAKIFAVGLVLCILVVLLINCGDSNDTEKEKDSFDITDDYQIRETENFDDDTEAVDDETTEAEEKSVASAELKQIADDYVSIAEEYLAFAKKYNKNDSSMITKSLELSKKAADFAAKANNFDTSTVSTSDAKYLADAIAKAVPMINEAAKLISDAMLK